jgi:hypothetical protein
MIFLPGGEAAVHNVKGLLIDYLLPWGNTIGLGRSR